jgi:hypothetical protein
VSRERVPCRAGGDELPGRPVERGQAITLNYTISLGLGLLVVTGLLVAGGNFVGDQREQATRAELRVVGQQVAATVASADRLASTTDGSGTVRLSRSLPDRVAGSAYSVELVASADAHLLVRSANPDVEISVAVLNETALSASTVGGGDVVVNLTASQKLRLEREKTNAS